ncbi:Panacea domain-containing protein [Streptococcus alactolyticus]|uniref:Panacea domain-containing protein n=1 Tax=Streptococcus alactolyticus TaxID=29389 RepID=UPI0037516872
MSMKELANHIIAVAHDNELPITNLQLQKILYFTLRNSRRYLDEDTLKETYNEPFLVWRYGPVVESQYNRFYSYGSSPIIDSFNQIPKYKKLNEMILRFLKIDVFRMVDASHTHKFWKDNSPRIKFGRSDIEYPLEEVLRDNQ